MATPNQIVVDSSTNVVDIQTNDNQLYITSNVPNTEITVTQPVTSVIQVATIGPKGDKGDKGDPGISINNQIATGSVTASVNVGSDTFKVTSGSSAFLYINSSGNTGIGTTSPITKLHVSGNIYAEDNLIIPSGKDILIRDVSDDTTGPIIRGTYDRSGTDPSFDYI